VAGVSRSASICIAYLIKYDGMTLKQAYEFVQAKRSQIRPNIGFFQQLIEFEESIHGITTVKMVHCAALGQDFPDVYEPEFRSMELIYQKYRKFFANR
jgi:atypical dual specificity phosphatase